MIIHNNLMSTTRVACEDRSLKPRHCITADEQEFDNGLPQQREGRTGSSAERRPEATLTATFANTDLRDVPAEIAKQTGVTITPDATVKATPITAEFVQVSIDAALQQVLKNTGYHFRKADNGTYLVFWPLSNSFMSADLAQTLQDLSMAARVPIVAAPDVSGTVTVTFEDMPLDEALALMLVGKPYVLKKTPYYYLVAGRNMTSPSFPEISETRRVRLNYTQAGRVKQRLSPVFSPYVQVEQPNPRDPNDQGDTLLVTATPAIIERIVADIKQIDRRKPQVLLDARVVSMEKGSLLNLGAGWNWPTIQGGVSSSAGPTNSTGTAASGWPYGVQIGYAPDQTLTNCLMMQLNLLVENKQADIIANPKVVAQDGRRAEMKVIQERWLMMTPTDPNSSVGGKLSKIESGTVLTITPYVGDNNDITLQMAVEVTDSIPKARGTDLPLVTRRIAKNAVTVKDGGTVAVAGLTENRSRTNEQRVPVLSDIPLVGELFKNRNEYRSSREAAVFVTVHLVPVTGTMPAQASASGATVVRVPPSARESGPVGEGSNRSEAPVPLENQEQAKSSIQIGVRFLAADEQFLKDLRGQGVVGGVTSPQDTETLHEIGRRLFEGQAFVLTDEQAGLLGKATQGRRDCSMLSAPKMTVLENRPCSFSIGSPISYTSGYEEPNEPTGKPKPRQGSLHSGVSFQATAHRVGQEGIELDGAVRMTTLLGFDEKKYQGRYRYQVPRTEDVVFSVANGAIPNGGTALFLGPKARLLKASDKPRTILVLVTPAIVESTMRSPDSPAWYVMRQANCPPLLLGLTQQLLKVLPPARRNDPMWQEVAGGGSLKLDVTIEHEQEREIIVGLFRDAKWSQEPVAVWVLPGAGTHTLTGLPAGRYQIGAMMGRAPSPAALGVQRTWPAAIEIKPGQTTAADLLVSPDFAFNASGRYNREVSRDYTGDWSLLDQNHLLQGRLTGPDGVAIAFGRVGVREYQAVPTGSLAAPELGTNEDGIYKFDKMKWPYRMSAQWSDTLPDLLGYRYQGKEYDRLFEGPQKVDFQFDSFPAGTARIAGRVVDEHGVPVTTFFLRVRTLDSSAAATLRRNVRSRGRGLHDLWIPRAVPFGRRELCPERPARGPGRREGRPLWLATIQIQPGEGGGVGGREDDGSPV